MVHPQTAFRQQIRDNAIKAGNDPDTLKKIEEVKPGIIPVKISDPDPKKPSEVLKENNKKSKKSKRK